MSFKIKATFIAVYSTSKELFPMMSVNCSCLNIVCKKKLGLLLVVPKTVFCCGYQSNVLIYYLCDINIQVIGLHFTGTDHLEYCCCFRKTMYNSHS